MMVRSDRGATKDRLPKRVEAQLVYEDRIRSGSVPDDLRFESYIGTSDAWRHSPTGRGVIIKIVLASLALLVILAVAWAIIIYIRNAEQPPSYDFDVTQNYDRRWKRISILCTVFTLALIVVCAGLLFFVYAERRRQWENEVLIQFRDSLIGRDEDEGRTGQTVAGSLAAKRDLQFETLWEDNKSQIERYHRIVLNYATSARVYTLVSLGVGFVFILIISVVAITAHGDSAIPASVVTAAAAALTGFVARAALRNSEASSQELRAFFAHPLDVERALAAERLVNEMPDVEQGEARLIIIRYLASSRDSQVGESKPKT
ncbi:MAG: hypothetical protein QOC63_3919 [Mycobacterium sp.]|jgi:hypothetical protein|nr:hypothetical protein [Mycobacterium sp.]